MHGTTLLLDVVVLLLASLPTALVLRRLGLPPVVGYIAVGALLGPHALGAVRAEREVEALSEIGVALLLFTIGLEFSVPRLLRLKREMLLGGGGQVLLTIAAFAGLAWAIGLETQDALLLGGLSALSSTALILKAYGDRQELETPHGRLGVAVLLFQDLAIIPLMLAVPIIAGGESPGLGGVAAIVGKALLAVGVVLVAARYGFARLAQRVVQLGGRELFVLAIAVVALGAAWLTSALGLPLALGAFVAGLVISESEYSQHVVGEVIPFRDVFSALFFTSVGMLLDPAVVLREPATVALWTTGLVAVKGAVLFGVSWFVTRSARVALLVACGLFQVGEFSFVLARQIQSYGALEERDAAVFLAVAVISMLMTPFAVQLAPRLVDRLLPDRGVGAGAAAPVEAEHLDVLIAGFGLTGQHLARVLSATSIPHRIVDLNPETVRRGQATGVAIAYGDVSHAEGLRAAGVERARVFVVAINDPQSTRRAVRIARQLNPKARIVVRTRFMAECDELRALGADQVVPAELETSLELFGRVLGDLGVPRGTIAVQKDVIRRESYRLFRGDEPYRPDLAVVGQLLDEATVQTVHIAPDCWAAGRTLRELDLRQRTGASVIAAARKGESLVAPGGEFTLEPGDLLVVLGGHPQLEAVRAVFAGARLDELG